jgi:hypothetical protein
MPPATLSDPRQIRVSCHHQHHQSVSQPLSSVVVGFVLRTYRLEPEVGPDIHHHEAGPAAVRVLPVHEGLHSPTPHHTRTDIPTSASQWSRGQATRGAKLAVRSVRLTACPRSAAAVAVSSCTHRVLELATNVRAAVAEHHAVDRPPAPSQPTPLSQHNRQTDSRPGWRLRQAGIAFPGAVKPIPRQGLWRGCLRLVVDAPVDHVDLLLEGVRPLGRDAQATPGHTGIVDREGRPGQVRSGQA